MTADGFLGQLFVALNVDTSGLANAATEFTRFQQKIITTAKMTNEATAQAANISDARLGKAANQAASYYRGLERDVVKWDNTQKNAANQYSGYMKKQENDLKNWDKTQAFAARQYGSYVKQQITDSKQWEAHQQKWRGVEENYYKQQAVARNKALSAYNAAQKTANAQESQYYRQQAQEAAAAERAIAKANQGIGLSLNSLSNNLYRFGTFATMAFTLPLAALATLGVKSAVELEQIKQKTVALANVSQEQMDAWSGAITRIGIATNATSKSIAQALYFVSSAGVDNVNAMKMVEYAAKGTAAGLGETDVIAKLLTYTYNAYGKEAFDAAKRMDELTVAVREGAAEATDFAVVMGDLIPIAAQIGVTFADLGGMLAGMTQIGLNAHKSATALRQVMMEMIRPSKQAAKALDEASVKMGDMSIASRNLAGTVEREGLFPVLQKLKLVSETMGPLFLPTVFDNIRSFNGLMAMIGPNMDKVQEIIRKTKTEIGAFDNALSIMTQTSEFKLGQFKKAWELAMLDLGKSILPTLLPILDSLAKTIKDLTTWFNSLSSSMKVLVLDFGVFLALLGPLTIALSGMVRLWAIIGMAWTGMIIPAIHAVGSALVWLSGIMLANPYIAVAAGIVLLVYGLNSLNNVTKELTEGQKILQSAEVKASQSVMAEKVAIEQLMLIATNVNSSLEQKNKALKTLNAISPEYLEGINQETIRTGEATRAIDRYLKSLQLKAEKESIYAALVEANKKRALALGSGSDKELKGFQNVEAFLFGNKREAQIQIENANKATAEFNDTSKRLWDRWNMIPYEIQRVERAAIRTEEILSIYPKKGSISDPITYFTTAKYLEDMYGIMIKYNYLVNNSKPEKGKGSEPPEQTDLEKAFATYKASLEGVRIRTKLFGVELKGVFNMVSETLSAKKTYFDFLIEKGLGATKVVKDLAKEIKALTEREEYGKGSNSLLKGIDQLPIKNLDLQISKFGKTEYAGIQMSSSFPNMIADAKDKVEYTKALADIEKEYQALLSKNETNLISTSNRSQNPWKLELSDLKALIEKKKESLKLAQGAQNQGDITKYTKEINDLLKPAKFQAGFQKFNAYFQEIGKGINNMLTSYVDMINQKQQKAYDFIDNVAKREGKSAEWVAKQKGLIDDQYNKKKRQAAIAEAIINGALAITNIWAYTKDPTGVGLRIVASALSVANTAAQIAVISGQKMAMGGIVPSGYNNDTYPALLSSGETVIPASPRALPNFVNGNRSDFKLLRVAIQGRDVEYIYEEQVKLQNAY